MGVRMTEQRDADLVAKGIRFLPWVGEAYEKGFRGAKLLVLGESHYHTWNGEKHDLDSDITRTCVRLVVKRCKCAPFFPNIEQCLLNEQ
jgi:hypothetical protein